MSKTNNTTKKHHLPSKITKESAKPINITKSSATQVCDPIVDDLPDSFKFGFWDKSCSKFTKKLWKPPLNQELYTPNWGNDNELLTLERSRTIQNATQFKFLPSPELDNTHKKRLLFNKKFGGEISRFEKFIESKELVQEFVHKYIKDLREGLKPIRKRKNKNNTLDAFNFSNSTFKRFRSKYRKAIDISDAEKKIIDPHI